MRPTLVKLIQLVLLTLGPLVLLISFVQHEQTSEVLDDFLDYKPTKSYFTKRDYYLVPHAHDDPGWIFTMREAQDKFKLQNDGLVEYLGKHPEYKFTFADIVFLLAWEDENPGSLNKFRKLVESGQVEIVNCGMSIPDQVLVHYDDLINIFEYGREYCKHELGVLPDIGWSVDSFGFGSYMSRIFAEMGYTHQVINRLPYLGKKEMKRRKEVFFNWRGVHEEDDLPTFITPTHYKTPPPSNQPFPNCDFLDSGFNLLDQVRVFMFHLETMSGDFATEKVLIYLGDDFSYVNFTREAKGYYNLILGVRSNIRGVFKNSTLQISSFREFIKDFDSQRPTLANFGPGDFLPHIDAHQALGDRVWTGYYFLRPSFKFLGKNFGKLFRGMTEQLAWQHLQNQSLTPEKKPIVSAAFRDAKIKQGLMTHHDAITGTSAHFVIKDYQRLINDTVGLMNKAVASSLTDARDPEYLLGKIVGMTVQREQEGVAVHAANGAVRAQRHFAVKSNSRCPREGTWFVESDSKVSGAVITDKKIGCKLEVADTKEFSPFERRIYKVSHVRKADQKKSAGQAIKYKIEDIAFNEERSFQVGETILKVTLTSNEISVKLIKDGKMNKSFTVGLWSYREWPRNTHDNIKNLVGIYTMRTLNKNPDPVKLSSGHAAVTADSVVLTLESREYPATALHLVFQPSAGNRQIRAVVSMDMLILPFLIDYMVRMEFDPVSRESGFSKIFYTDSNGQDVMKRTFDDTDRVERSFYPIASFISVPTSTADKKFRAVSVLVDRPTAATSPQPGIIELGVARNNQGKDNLGVHESGHDLDETHSEFVIVWEDTVQSEVAECLPSYAIRRVQLEADSELLLATVSSQSRIESVLRTGVTGDSDSKKFAAVSGHCGHPERATDLLRVLIDQRIEGLMARVYNLSPDCSIMIKDMKSYLKTRLGLSKDIQIEERSVDFNQAAADICVNVPLLPQGKRLREIALSESSRGGGYLLKPLKYKTFRLF